MPAISLPETSPIETWTQSKPPVRGTRGVVASQNVQASEAGAAVLAAGGNAADAAVATALALTVAEPWMSGLGGGGYAIVHDAKSGTTRCVDFGMQSGSKLDPADYALVSDTEGTPDMFGWPAVVEDRNLQGYHSIALPGSCAGYATLLSEFGSWSWADAISPAITMAERGHRLTWWTTLNVAAEIAWLRKYEASASVWLPGGEAPVISDHTNRGMPMGNFADTLKRLRDAGPQDFYTGEIAKALVADLQAGGSRITAEDMAGYEAKILEPITRSRGGTEYNLAPGYTAGPTFAGALSRLPEFSGKIDPAAYKAHAEALIESYKVRLSTMGHAGDVGDRSCTTHLSVLDAEGNMVVMTTTLLSRFGSRVVLPKTGVLMNNGINWFDPRPDRANSLAPGQKALSNMCPMLATRDGKAAFGLGASGGRKIMPAIFQLTSFINDFGMDLEAAFMQPRIDISLMEKIVADDRVGPEVVAALESVLPVEQAGTSAFPGSWAIPCGVMVTPEGPMAAAHVFGPLNAAVPA